MNRDERLKQYDRAVKEARELFVQRNDEYGDAFEECGLLGSVVEITSCSSRLKNLLLRRMLPKEAQLLGWKVSVRDKLLDTLNYAVISLMLLDESNWRGK